MIKIDKGQLMRLILAVTTASRMAGVVMTDGSKQHDIDEAVADEQKAVFELAQYVLSMTGG